MLSSGQNLCILKDILKGILFNNWWAIQIRWGNQIPQPKLAWSLGVEPEEVHGGAFLVRIVTLPGAPPVGH